jgi:sterol 3beta-glucosyltransferase
VRIAMITIGTRGDAQPMVVLATELRRRGHDVSLGLPPNLEGFGKRAGFDVTVVGPDTQAYMESPEGRTWLAAGNVKAFMDALSQVAHQHNESMNAEVLEVCSGADVIVAGLLTEDRAACIGEAQGIPVVTLHMAPFRRTRSYPNCFVTSRPLPGPLNFATGMMFDMVWWKGLKADINDFRTELGLATTKNSTPVRLDASGSVQLQAFSPTVAPVKDYGTHRPIIGNLNPDAGLRASLGEGVLDPELDNWLTEGDAPAFLGFGSMPVTDPAAALEMIDHVTQNLGLRALVGAGWSDIAGSASDNDRVRVAGSINHDLVLPRCRVAVHHGGAGTTMASISAGVPTLVCSVFADQPFWGRRLEKLGVGAHLRFAELDATRLEDSLRPLLDPAVAARASALASAVSREPVAAGRGADIIETVISR